jgi:2-polyprenyl-3-methyl-5-hydroxy-6-metoxy-1,4-benzoquinol methylase
MAEIAFTKYEKKGAYHWAEIEPGDPNFNAYTAGRFDVAIDCLAEAGIGAGMRIVDVGCGDGALAGLAQRRLSVEVAGIDPSEAAIELARGQFAKFGLRGEFQSGSAYSISAPDGAFDGAVCADVIEHVREPERLLVEIRRVLRPGGVLVLTTPLRVTERPVDPFHVQEWFHEEFIAVAATVFGKPERAMLSHPAFWLEAYRRSGSTFWRWMRLYIHFMSRQGRNPFVHGASNWRLQTQQSLVLRKAGRPA